MRRFALILSATLLAAGGSLPMLSAQAPAPAPSGTKAAAPPAVPGPAAGSKALSPARGNLPGAGGPVGPVVTPSTPGDPKAPVNNPKAVEIINRYIDSLGGNKLLDKIIDRVQKFRNIKHAATGDTVAALNQFLKKGYKVREEWDIEGVKIKDNPLAFTQVYNGTDGWVQMFGTVSPLEGRTLSLFVWDKLLDDPFCHWEEDGYSLDYIGAGTVDGEASEIVEMADFGASKKERYYFSKDSGLLLKKEWKEQGQNGLAKKEIVYKKYRKIPFSDNSGLGLQFALLQEVYEDGDIDTTREYTEVKINSGLNDAIFERPPGEEFKGAIGGPPPGLKSPQEKAAPKPPTPPSPHPVITPAPPAPAPAPAPAPSPGEKK